MPQPWLTAGDAAASPHVHVNTIRRWSDLGLLQGERIGPRGDRRFPRAEVEKMRRRGYTRTPVQEERP